MSWNQKSERGGRYETFKTALILPDGAATDVDSAVLSEVPPGQDFFVFANLAGTDLTADGDIDILAGFTETGPFAVIKADLIASIDNAVVAALYDVSEYGDAPHYKIRITSDGNQAEEVVEIGVVFATPREKRS